MSTRTYYYNLTKPDNNEHVSLSVINQNSDLIDAQMHANSEAARNASENVTDAYDSTANYVIGDFCIYQNVLYKCTSPTTGDFDSTKWTQTNIETEFEPKRTWEVFETITTDGNTKRYDRNITEPISGLFITFEVEAASASDIIQIYAWFGTDTTVRRAGYINNGLNTAARYSHIRYTRDGNLWMSEQSSAASAITASTTLGRNANGFHITTDEMVKFRIDTNSLNFPSGSTITIYVRR